ncbi:type I-C CRISPR-associated protein Cas8c/Csd1 [Aggregatibacter actinomycetemcomitans]|uniref:type I-C CRISPR-associated protein Cas8c/Csd1 n=2 Tax=Aggregatibacter actinomycetemcomitans TaxID=714 RepID=UPI00022ABF56|nr:type I-C CRISPR-associated protein Cas8c/Csd1 [Aggregatibacter actinomycetemcomitans]ANU82253.1 type I-C CRISPR-associated protein Cas8c/Csd1 [Aggregatibacter actinomycetemcomitans]KOE67237.1 CRISPR-associated protein Csd1 [Aggregatibacter actinomycetemcomitans serotype d str. I63B]KYK82925.1 CRISPR-associated protein Csd1 [Aggregatibacter actinomycetemcomitans serotype d str. SA3033]MBN6073306.1 type I-C CRISPR-associated protein Cas8c/Csd1 [Aggregatibacter actinomycetemcomitans]
MSWMQKLCRTYEYVQEQGLEDEDLALPFHMSKAVHLKVILNNKAELVGVERFEGKKQVPIQVTEKSSKRAGSTIAPYALHDGLQYIAKTAKEYLTIEYLSKVAEKENGKKWKNFLAGTDEDKRNFADTEKTRYKTSFKAYEEQLSAWAEASHLQEIKIVLQYIQKGSLIEDLLEKKVFTLENNILLAGKDDPFNFTIVWAVEIPNDLHSNLWSKSSIKEQWIKYQESQSGQEDEKPELCYITGESSYLANAYPKIEGNAKLVSANDTDGFTFLGRFLIDKQAAALGREVSQKAFNMLKWLIKRQGIRNGDQVTVAWAISGKAVPSPMKDLSDEIDWDNLDISADESAVENSDRFSSPTSSETPDWSTNIGKPAAQIIKKKLHGYQEELKNHEQISLIMLDSATPGRMALTYYQEFLPADYFANLDAWVDDFSWYQRYSVGVQNGKKTDKRTQWRGVPPSPYSVADAVYGKSLSDTLKKQLYARLLPVIAGGKSVPIPDDLMQKSFQVACNPNGSENWEWQRNIGVACALYKGWRARHHDLSERRTYSMALDKENRSRDYLYGRLLAVAENTESYALYLVGEKRATTAERYMQRFAEHPFATWRNIELALKPYQDRLRNNGKDTGAQAIGEIMDLFENQDFSSDDKLSGEFLLGYHCQKMDIARRIAEISANKSKTDE